MSKMNKVIALGAILLCGTSMGWTTHDGAFYRRMPIQTPPVKNQIMNNTPQKNDKEPSESDSKYDSDSSSESSGSSTYTSPRSNHRSASSSLSSTPEKKPLTRDTTATMTKNLLPMAAIHPKSAIQANDNPIPAPRSTGICGSRS